MAERVTLGATGLSVSPVAFGTWQLSPRFWGDQPKKPLLDAMETAYAGGINLFDTADAYGDGHAETVLGEFLAGKPRDRVVVCTKVYNHFKPDGGRYPDLSPAYLRERCETQLKRLRVETIDIYLTHFFDTATHPREVAETMEDLRRQGKIRFAGTSNHTVEQLRAQCRFGPFPVVQPAYSLLDPGIEADLLPHCEAEDLGVMIYSPMHKGLLTGKYAGTETFTDFRKNHPDFQGDRFRAATAAVRGLRPLAEKYGLTLYQFVLAATLMHPAIHVAVVGTKTPEQIREALGAMGKTISREDYFEVRKALDLKGGTKVMDAKGSRK